MNKLLAKLNLTVKILLAAGICALGIVFCAIQLYQPHTFLVDGLPMEIKGIAFTTRSLLNQAGIVINPEDSISTSLDGMTWELPPLVTIHRARPVSLHTPEGTIELHTVETLPANLLQQAGISLYREDLLLRNGLALDPYAPLPGGEPALLQFIPAKQVKLDIDGSQASLFTQAGTLAEALEEAGTPLSEKDDLSLPLETRLDDITSLEIVTAREVQVVQGDVLISGMTAARTVAEALDDLGVTLQDLDYSVPSEDQSIPPAGSIEIRQVRETVTLEKEETQYGNSYQADPEAELDTISVIDPGQLGLVVTRTRSRTENGEFVNSQTDGPWKASDPRNGILGTGTQVVIRTEVVDGTTIEYWRKVSVYATSYHPSEFDNGAITRSGVPLTKGIVAVATSWWGGLQGQPVFVPGYGHGIIADTGGGIPGTRWIDLGYDDDNYVGWHDWTTLYFLTPVPAYVQPVLP